MRRTANKENNPYVFPPSKDLQWPPPATVQPQQNIYLNPQQKPDRSVRRLSTGKIVRNRSNCSRQSLADIHNQNQKSYPNTTTSASKKKQLEEKYQKILRQYEQKVKILDEEMNKIENKPVPSRNNSISSFRHENPGSKQPEQSQSRKYAKNPILTTTEDFTSEFITKPLKPKVQKDSNCPGVVAIKPIQDRPKQKTQQKECLRTSKQQQHNRTQTIKTNIQKIPSSGGELETILRKFSDAISVQIGLQAQLRNLKNNLPKKLQKSVKAECGSNELYSIPEDVLKIDFQEYDPFAENKPQYENIKDEKAWAIQIYLAYKNAEDHWHQMICNRFSRQEVRQIFQKMDFQHTGILSVKTVARELGIIMNRNLRNRDLYRICKRIDKEDKITLTALTKCLCRQSS